MVIHWREGRGKGIKIEFTYLSISSDFVPVDESFFPVNQVFKNAAVKEFGF